MEARISISELKRQLQERGISTLGMIERDELEKALRENSISSKSTQSTKPSSTIKKNSIPVSSKQSTVSTKRPLSSLDCSTLTSSLKNPLEEEEHDDDEDDDDIIRLPKKIKKLKKKIIKKVDKEEKEAITCYWAFHNDEEGDFLKKTKKKKLDPTDFMSGWFYTNDDLPIWFSKQCNESDTSNKSEFPTEISSSFSFLTKRKDLQDIVPISDREEFKKRRAKVRQLGKERGGYSDAELDHDLLFTFYRDDEIETSALISTKAKSLEEVQTMLYQRIKIKYEEIRKDVALAKVATKT
jgi:hypothetical protein